MSGRPAAILLLESNPDHCERMVQAFAAANGGFSLTVVANLAQARSRLRAVNPDLVITAATLSDGLGLELIPQPQNPMAYPVIVLTERGSEKEAVAVLKAGALDYVVKTDTALADMPHIARHALRDWGYVIDRQRAEAALWKSEASYRTLAENLPAIVYRMFAIDMERRLFYSGMLETMTGYPPAELGVQREEISQGHSYTRANRISSIEKMIVPEEREVVLDRVREAFSKNRSFITEYRIRDKKDHIRYFSERGKPVVDGEGMVAHIDGVIFDVTDQKRTELALRESRKRWEDIVKNAAVGIYQVTAKGEFILVNPRLARIFGFDSPRIFLNAISNMAQLYADPEEHHQLLEQINASGYIEATEVKFRNRMGQVIWGRLSTRAIEYQSGKTIYEGFIVDITEHKALQARLQQAQKMEAIGTLAGGIAHDFNNILSAIIGYSEIARQDAGPDGTLKGYLENILEAGERARTLVSQILTFSRKSERESEAVQIKYVVKEALKMLRASLPATIEIKSHIKSEAIIQADPTQIHQVMMNLCTNASHAMRETGGTLGVSLVDVDLDATFVQRFPNCEAGPYLNLSISDSGHGMSSAVMERIFDPYFSTKEKGEGTGLGLAVVQGIVHHHCGAITVTSEPGHGSTFDLYFPVQTISVATQDTPELPIEGGSERILLVDDEEMLTNVGKNMLERLGYNVTTHTDSERAWEHFKAQPDEYDLVITDMTMPHMTGDELSRKMLSLRPELPIIICTGYSDKIHQDKAVELGLKGFILKPLIKKDLAHIIRRVLDNPHSEGLL